MCLFFIDSGQVIMVQSAVFLCIFPGHSFFYKDVTSCRDYSSVETQKNEHRAAFACAQR